MKTGLTAASRWPHRLLRKLRQRLRRGPPLLDQEAYVGLISGTSVDGVDACVATFDADGRLASILAHDTFAYPETLQRQLVATGQGHAEGPLELFATLDQEVGQAFAKAAAAGRTR